MRFPNLSDRFFQMELEQLVCPNAVSPQAGGRNGVTAFPYWQDATFRRGANQQQAVATSTAEYEPSS
jgi:hypothetical protein